MNRIRERACNCFWYRQRGDVSTSRSRTANSTDFFGAFLSLFVSALQCAPAASERQRNEKGKQLARTGAPGTGRQGRPNSSNIQGSNRGNKPAWIWHLNGRAVVRGQSGIREPRKICEIAIFTLQVSTCCHQNIIIFLINFLFPDLQPNLTRSSCG